MDNILSSPTLSFLIILPSALAVVALSSLFRSYYRLQHIPGPIIPSLTDWWATINIWTGRPYSDFIPELHEKYGPVVRWGPNRVSFAKPDAVADIYGINRPFPKAASYEPMVVVNNGKPVASLIGTRNERHITEVKRHISVGFSQSTWLKQEGQIDSVLQLLISQLRAKVGSEIDLRHWLSFWSFDTLATVAFGESRGYLKHGEDIDGVFASGSARFRHWGLWMSMPSLEQLIYKNRFAQKPQKGGSALVQMALNRIQERKDVDKEAAGHDLLGRYLAASQAAPDVIAPNDVLGLTISTIHAGSETTASNASMVLLRVLENPRIFSTLEQEILHANLSDPPTFAQVDALPYLNACIHESMRLTASPNCFERTVAPADAEISGVRIPAGTDVSICETFVNADVELFGADAAVFRPERWLDVEKAKFAEMDRAGFGFGYGRRHCIGQHLARIEMKKGIAALVASFKIHLAERPEWWVEDTQVKMSLKVRLEERV
ncbi:hypothetical protein M409DRAFT_56535 [Zasmidium cellare ATCC 36951]|uniref:Cytochrome P450 n=1 Tax=Zasmidium cellare ATCC 36951 TaxID=1080233 RepID=A0A6A6CEZ3_ZASCE|nr:uncharacterized protein M409DRAFT_56535 [Zasmidium cellare ATCC 36951]KAF2164728.1 hypothetical protein M409DRAFT_56535 [Zasmidium cellare ATCC 36951]